MMIEQANVMMTTLITAAEDGTTGNATTTSMTL